MYVIYPTAPYLGNIDVYVYSKGNTSYRCIYVYNCSTQEKEEIMYEIHR